MYMCCALVGAIKNVNSEFHSIHMPSISKFLEGQLRRINAVTQVENR
jgi:hypothetical protein